MPIDTTYGWSMIYSAILAQGLFLTAALWWAKKGNRRANRFLAIMMLTFCSALVEIILRMTGLIYQWPHFLFVSTPFWYILPPAYYFYAKNLAGDCEPLKKTDLLHLIPVVAVIIRYSYFYSWPVETKLDFLQNPDAIYDRHSESIVFSFLYAGQSAAYLFSSHDMLRGGGDNRNGINYWIKFIYGVLAAYMVFDIVDTATFLITGHVLMEWGRWSIPFMAALIYSVAFLAFVKPEKLFLPPWVRKYDLTGIENSEIVRRLKEVMDSEKLYLEADLKYSDVASKLGISVRSLSRALNEEMRLTFNDFVNSYRVTEVKKLMVQNHEIENILTIALNAGFSGKSTFNRVFKQHTGVTPSEFIRDLSNISAVS